MLQFNFAFAQSTNCETTVTPSVTIVSDQNSVCRGLPLTFTATPINGGPFPSYIWYVNGIQQFGYTNTFTSNTFDYGDEVFVKLSSSLPCISSEFVFSNIQKVIVIYPYNPPIIGSDTTICSNVVPNPIKEVLPVNFSPEISYAWENSLDGITWSRIADAKDKTLVFKEPLKNTAFFRRILLNNEGPLLCPAYKPNTVKIVVIDGPECQTTFTNDQTIEATKTVLGIYNIQGMEVDKNHKGLVLYKYTDGSISKILQE
jgi:hypothetical protein